MNSEHTEQVPEQVNALGNEAGRLGRLQLFITGMVPLGIIYAASAILWRSHHSADWMWANLTVLLLMVVYVVVWSMMADKRAGIRKHPVRWIHVVLQVVNKNRWFARLGLILPVFVLALSFVSDWLHWGGGVTWTLLSIASVLYLIYVVLVMFSTGYEALGLMLHAKERQLAQSRRETALLRREQELASRTHDTVTGALSSIALLAEQQQDEAKDDSGAHAWSVVNTTALQALDNLHQVIDILGNSTVQGGDEAEEGLGLSSKTVWKMNDFMLAVTDTAAKEDIELKKLGFHGKTTVRDTHTLTKTEKIDKSPVGAISGECADESEFATDITTVDGRVAEEVLKVLGEIYANIRFHADPDDEYHCEIRIEDKTVIVAQANTISAIEHKTLQGHRSGRGLHLHQQVIEQLGGSLKAEAKAGNWRIRVTLPYKDLDSHMTP